MPARPDFPHIIFLNGPAGSGKSTLASRIQNIDSAFHLVDLAIPLREAVLDLLHDVDEEIDLNLELQEHKARLIPPEYCLDMMTYRTVLVKLGHFVRETFGADFLAKRAVRYMHVTKELVGPCDFIIPNCRTLEDCANIVSNTTPSRCFVLHLIREGYDWSGDLGGYFTAPAGVPSATIVNDGSIDDLVTKALDAMGALTVEEGTL